MKVVKRYNLFGFTDYKFIKNNIVFTVTLDKEYIIFSMADGTSFKSQKKEIEMVVTKNELVLFEIIENLYNKIVAADFDFIVREENTSDKYLGSDVYKQLVDTDMNVTWNSDKFNDYVINDSFSISRIDDDSYRLLFKRVDDKVDYLDNSHIDVAINRKKSKYFPFNIMYLNAYREMQKIGVNVKTRPFDDVKVNVKDLKN